MERLPQWVYWTACAGLVLMPTACSGPVSSDSRAADEAAIRQSDAASLKAIAAKQLDTTVSFYEEGASVMIPNAPIVTGREEIRKAWVQMFAAPGFTLAPQTTKLEVARSGDLAYVQGTYRATANDAEGASATDRGKFVVVWKKQADGTWKIAADIWNSDLPAVSAPK